MTAADGEDVPVHGAAGEPVSSLRVAHLEQIACVLERMADSARHHTHEDTIRGWRNHARILREIASELSRPAVSAPTVKLEERVTRVELIDHRASFEDGGGRVFAAHDVAVVLEIQDAGRTLKVFVDECAPAAVSSPDVQPEPDLSDLPFPAIGPDPDAENDPTLHDLDTVCAWCGLCHITASVRRGCPCTRHIDGGSGTGRQVQCNAAFPSAPEGQPR